MIWFLAGLILLIYVINKLTLSYGFKNLTYEMEIDKATAEIGEEIEITAIIENRKPFTISFLKVEEVFPEGFNIKSNIYPLFIMPFQRVRRKYKIAGEKRGLYKIKDVNMELGDFVGFDKTFMNLTVDKEVIIYPRKVDLKESIVPIGYLNGDISVKKWIIEDPIMTVGIREYTGFEPQKYIHWPSSLRYNNLMVKNFDFTTDNRVIIVLNIETMKPFWQSIDRESIEKSISIVRALMEEFEEAKIPYGLATNAYNVTGKYGQRIFYHPGLGLHHLNGALKILGRINYVISEPFEDTIKGLSRKQGNYSTLVIVTPEILDPYIPYINNLSKVVNKTVLISIKEDRMDQINKNIVKFRGD